MFFNELIERMGHDEMREIQIKKLRKEAAWAYANVPFYKERFDELGMNPAEIKALRSGRNFRSRSRRIFGTIIPSDCSQFQRKNWREFTLPQARRASQRWSDTQNRT